MNNVKRDLPFSSAVSWGGLFIEKILRNWQVAVTHTLSTALKVCPLHKSPTNETRSMHKFNHWNN